MEKLYHYCSNQGFLSIIENRSIWLSALSLSNDSMEGKIVSERLMNIAKLDNLDETVLPQYQTIISGLDSFIDGLGFCLSESGDLLSQWRGYANDATGVSVGFSKNYLEQLSEVEKPKREYGFKLHKVEYKSEFQESLLKPTYATIKKLIEEGAFNHIAKMSSLKIRSEEERKKDLAAFYKLLFKTLELLPVLFLLKGKAFQEEREWRIISYLVKNGDINECSFRAMNDRILPYREFELLDLETDSIVEVILGPKNMTPNYIIDGLLKQNGFTNVVISRSEATYR